MSYPSRLCGCGRDLIERAPLSAAKLSVQNNNKACEKREGEGFESTQCIGSVILFCTHTTIAGVVNAGQFTGYRDCGLK